MSLFVHRERVIERGLRSTVCVFYEGLGDRIGQGDREGSAISSDSLRGGTEKEQRREQRAPTPTPTHPTEQCADRGLQAAGPKPGP